MYVNVCKCKCNNADARRCSYFELGLPVESVHVRESQKVKEDI